MIYDRPLTAAQKKKSQRNYCYFNTINGISYMCLGETILILLAVKMNVSDPVISALGAMLYFGYLLLPLGKITAARFGGARSQSIFWVCRNIAALMVASSAAASCFGYQKTALVLLLTGAFLYYGFRAAGVVMSQPLVGDISDENGSGKLLAVSNGIFFFTRMVTLIVITLVTNKCDSLRTLIAIIIFGAFCGIASSKFLNNIDETSSLRNSARQPLKPEIKWSLKDSGMRKQLLAGFFNNLIWIMSIPISTLAVKKGYNASDADALIFTISFSVGCCVMSFAGGKIAQKIGPRKQFISSYILFILTSFIWVFLPAKMPYIYMLIHFFILGTAGIWGLNSSAHYFLQTVSIEHRVGGSILLAVVTGVIAGFAGIIITGTLLKVTPMLVSTALDGYKMYFIITAVLMAPATWAFIKLPPLPTEKRRISRQLAQRIATFITKRH